MRVPPGLKRAVSTAFAAALFFLALMLPALIPSVFAEQSQRPVVNLTILHVNDTHGHILPFVPFLHGGQKAGGAAYLARMIENERAANPQGTLLLSAGDMFQGTPVSNLFHGKPVIEIMNYLHFDAMDLGNHEFDWGQGVLHSIISEASFPVISANVLTRDGGLIEGVKPYVLLDRKGVKIAVIGLTTPQTRYTTKAENVAGLTFSRPASVMPALIRDVRAKGASIVIALTHLGLYDDRELATEVQGIDLIVGGHSHTAIKNPVVESGTVIVQAGCYGLYLGVMKIAFDPNTQKVVSFTDKNELMPVSPESAPADPKVARIVDKYEARVKPEFSKTIGTAAVDLKRSFDGESNLGDLICDAMCSSSGARIGFQNRGGIRADIPAGPVTMDEVFTALPFDDNIMSMELTGKQIRETLEKSVAYGGLSLQVSGIRVVFDLSKPAGERVVSIEAAGKPLDDQASYRVATNDFLAAGGDHFAVFKHGRNISSGQSLREAVVEYIKRNSPLQAGSTNRIILK
ncbi:MAG: bifunctional UDP-sugar hydrolase/5'-nucleotidase [Syntrophobacteraceae bacterium]|nr:bifunctional UDP-sugar hydrolase/5'-nucleotidase [Syntrophobacteraceae bacterium]